MDRHAERQSNKAQSREPNKPQLTRIVTEHEDNSPRSENNEGRRMQYSLYKTNMPLCAIVNVYVWTVPSVCLLSPMLFDPTANVRRVVSRPFFGPFEPNAFRPNCQRAEGSVQTVFWAF